MRVPLLREEAARNMNIIVPALETERLLLRGHALLDFEASAAMWGDPLVARYISGKPSTRDQSWSRLHRYVGHWQLLGFGYWVVAEKASGEFVGEIGFADFMRVIEPPMSGIPELGWVLAAPFHGKGYATEALHAALAWGDAHLSSKRTFCIIDPKNVASLRVAEKIGYRELQHTTYNGDPTIMFERSNDR